MLAGCVPLPESPAVDSGSDDAGGTAHDAVAPDDADSLDSGRKDARLDGPPVARDAAPDMPATPDASPHDALGSVDAACGAEEVVNCDTGERSGMSYVCDGTSLHRVAAAECAANLRPPASCSLEPEGGGVAECTSDAECGDGAFCIAGVSAELCQCYTPCTMDAECGEGRGCLCRLQVPTRSGRCSISRVGWTRCVPAQCRTDADCPEGRLCMVSDWCVAPGFFCQTPDDTCRTHEDCGPGPVRCAYDVDAERWGCQPQCD